MGITTRQYMRAMKSISQYSATFLPVWSVFVAFFLAVTSVFLANRAYAADPVEALRLDGWTHLSSNGNTISGVVLAGSAPAYSSPVIAEIDGDTTNGKEVAAGGSDGKLYVYKADGTLLWSVNMPRPGCSRSVSSIFSSPAVGAIYGDGVPYVVVGYGGVGPKRCDGGVVAYRGSDGAKSWIFSTKKFAKKKFWAVLHSVVSSPSLADTDGDGKMEIGFGSFDRSVYLLNSNGTVRWYYQAADTVWSSPAFASVDGDSSLEMMIGTDISQNNFLRPPTKNGGYMYAFKTAARSEKLVRFRNTEGYHWQSDFDQVIYSSPVIADVLSSNPGNELIIGSGCFFPQGTNNKKGRWVKVLSLANGKLLQTLTAPTCLSSSVAVGDLDDDGVLEIVATTNGHSSVGGDGFGRVLAWKATNSEPIWSVIPKTGTRNDAYLGFFGSPVIADLDSSGSLEVVVSNENGIVILNGRDGRQLTCGDSSCSNSTLSLPINSTTRSTPAIGDLNNDGTLEIVALGSAKDKKGRGAIFAWTGFEAMLASDPGTQTPRSQPWPVARGNPRHTALYGDTP